MIQRLLTSSWQAEANGLGFAFRDVCCIPKCFPLLFMCQHGAEFNADLPELDIPNHYPSYLTWNPVRATLAELKHPKRIIQLCNPISVYFRTNYRNAKPSEVGLIHFFSHSGHGFYKTEEQLKMVLTELSNLGDQYGPVTICLHPADNNRRNLELCSEYGITVISNTSCNEKDYVDTMIRNILGHKYVGGIVNQTAVMYAIDFGLTWLGPLGDNYSWSYEESYGQEFMEKDLEYNNDSYAIHMSDLCQTLVFRHENEKILSVVRLHLGTATYKSRLIYACTVWSTYVHFGHAIQIFRSLKHSLSSRK